MWDEDENTPSGQDVIQNLLDEYNPSKLDEVVKTVCPFYEPADRNFTGTYLDFHEYAKVGILTRLQIRLEDLGSALRRKLNPAG